MTAWIMFALALTGWTTVIVQRVRYTSRINRIEKKLRALQRAIEARP